MAELKEVRLRVSRKYTIYIPKAVAKAVGLREKGYVKVQVVGSKIVLEPIPDPFDVALRGPKFADVTFEEFEKESEEMQRELFS